VASQQGCRFGGISVRLPTNRQREVPLSAICSHPGLPAHDPHMATERLQRLSRTRCCFPPRIRQNSRPIAMLRLSPHLSRRARFTAPPNVPHPPWPSRRRPPSPQASPSPSAPQCKAIHVVVIQTSCHLQRREACEIGQIGAGRCYGLVIFFGRVVRDGNVVTRNGRTPSLVLDISGHRPTAAALACFHYLAPGKGCILSLLLTQSG
jgi:hypothetical protein